MQTYDLVMIGVLAVATLLGFYKGMAKQIASITSLAVSYFAALRLSPALAAHIRQPEPLNRFIAMLVIGLLASLVTWLVFRKVSQFIDRVHLKEFDRQVGGLFGAAKGVLLCVVITFFAVSLSAASRQTVLASRSGKLIARFIHQAGPVMPHEIHKLLDPYLDQLEEQLTSARNGEPSRNPKRAPRALALDFDGPR